MSLSTWLLLALLLGTIMLHFVHTRRLIAKDRRIAELEEMLASYRQAGGMAGVADPEDVRNLLDVPDDSETISEGLAVSTGLEPTERPPVVP